MKPEIEIRNCSVNGQPIQDRVCIGGVWHRPLRTVGGKTIWVPDDEHPEPKPTRPTLRSPSIQNGRTYQNQKGEIQVFRVFRCGADRFYTSGPKDQEGRILCNRLAAKTQKGLAMLINQVHDNNISAFFGMLS